MSLLTNYPMNYLMNGFRRLKVKHCCPTVPVLNYFRLSGRVKSNCSPIWLELMFHHPILKG
jgi:hypothetical protein